MRDLHLSPDSTAPTLDSSGVWRDSVSVQFDRLDKNGQPIVGNRTGMIRYVRKEEFGDQRIRQCRLSTPASSAAPPRIKVSMPALTSPVSSHEAVRTEQSNGAVHSRGPPRFLQGYITEISDDANCDDTKFDVGRYGQAVGRPVWPPIPVTIEMTESRCISPEASMSCTAHSPSYAASFHHKASLGSSRQGGVSNSDAQTPKADDPGDDVTDHYGILAALKLDSQ